MAFCKILQDYENKNGWSKGQVVDITDPIQLIKEGKVVLLNEKGEEVAPSWANLGCPICAYKAENPVALAHHILDTHTGKIENPPKKTADTIKQQRIAALEKARAARKLKQLEENVKKHEDEVARAEKEAIEATKVT